MSGGYRRKPKIYKLEFEAGDMAGLEVYAKSLSVDSFLEVAGLADGLDAENPAGIDPAVVRKLFERFARCLQQWNLQDEDGTPVPATLQALLGEELPFALQIIMRWVKAMADVDPTLPGESSGGATSQEAQIPMEALSSSLAS